MKYNIWNKWDPLKVCMLGNNYAPEFFDGCDPKASDPLKRICEETLEDLDGYKTILQQFGVEVIQPQLDPTERFLDNPHRYPRGPLQPRDTAIILGNHAYCSYDDHPSIRTTLNDYAPIEHVDSAKFPSLLTHEEYTMIAGSDYPNYEDFLKHRCNKNFFLPMVWKELTNNYRMSKDFLSSACAFPIGTKLHIGRGEDETWTLESINDSYSLGLKNYEVNVLPSDGHADGNFHPIKPGAILSLFDVQNYDKTYPGWDVCYLPDQSWNKVEGFMKLKTKNSGKWWLAGEEDNAEFTHFVETWLQDWVGYVEETVFDVNVLVLDEHHVCVANPNNAQVNTFLKKHNMEPVHVPWRHRYFWDGGLHCITQELYREGTQKDYFG